MKGALFSIRSRLLSHGRTPLGDQVVELFIGGADLKGPHLHSLPIKKLVEILGSGHAIYRRAIGKLLIQPGAADARLEPSLATDGIGSRWLVF